MRNNEHAHQNETQYNNFARKFGRFYYEKQKNKKNYRKNDKKVTKTKIIYTNSTDCKQKNQSLYHTTVKQENCNKTKHHNKSYHLC